tara:strand:- start:9944 stop:10570 length:627 start_codon:yes stop_codon:yes gene_type:complete
MKTEVKSYKSVRIFKSDFWEKFTHIHPATPIVFFGPVVLYFLYRSFVFEDKSLGEVLLWGGAGLFFWTFAEYFLHRFLFHFKPLGPISERLLFILHEVHHEDPNDPTRLVMPPIPAVLLATAFYSLFFAVLGPERVSPFFAFFIIGYLCYDYIHYATHHFRMKGRIGKYLKQQHMLHHFAAPNKKYGVSNPLWDFVFRTYKIKKNSTH